MTFANVVAVIALFVALGGGAYAAAGNPFVGTGGTIQGCVRNGALDVVKAGNRCPKGTTALPFNQTAAPGTQATPGAGAAYFAYGANGGVVLSTSVGKSVTVLAKSGIPAGTYAVTAKVDVTATDTHTGTTSQVNCQLDDIPRTGSTVGDSDFWTPNTNRLVVSTYEDQTTLPLALDLTTTKTSTLSVECQDIENNNTTPSFTLTASKAEISAVQVSALR
jgi:hypothetical protein